MLYRELHDAVVDRLKAGWSPEQIAGRLKAEPVAPYRLCHETIYRFIYSPEGQSQDLARYLPERRRKRKPRYARKPRSLIFPETSAIRYRPDAVNSRQEFGHWEADLMIFRKEHGPAPVRAPQLDLRPWSRVCPMARAGKGLRHTDLVLRSESAVAEGIGRKYEQKGAPLPAARDGDPDLARSGDRQHLRPAKRHTTQMPGLPGRCEVFRGTVDPRFRHDVRCWTTEQLVELRGLLEGLSRPEGPFAQGDGGCSTHRRSG